MNRDLRAKLSKLALTEADVAKAVRWARKSVAPVQPGSVHREASEASKTKRSPQVK
jgi:hypothetical protein